MPMLVTPYRLGKNRRIYILHSNVKNTEMTVLRICSCREGEKWIKNEFLVLRLGAMWTINGIKNQEFLLIKSWSVWMIKLCPLFQHVIFLVSEEHLRGSKLELRSAIKFGNNMGVTDPELAHRELLANETVKKETVAREGSKGWAQNFKVRGEE